MNPQNRIFAFFASAVAVTFSLSCSQSNGPSETSVSTPMNAESESEMSEPAGASSPGKTEVATLGGGCFWCTEAVMERLDGVVDVKSGYMGGHVDNPTYEEICTKTTGHVEVIEVTFDPQTISFEEILDVFWQAHDPTTRDRQGGDVGPQYRSVVFYHSDEQKAAAEKSKAALDASGKYSDPAVTDIVEASKFWEAEEYHQDFYRNNESYGYCRVVIHPKLQKLGLLDKE